VTRSKSSRIIALSVVAAAWLAFLGFYWSARDDDGADDRAGDTAQESPVTAEAPTASVEPPADAERVAAPERSIAVQTAKTPAPPQNPPAAIVAAPLAVSAPPPSAGSVAEPPAGQGTGETGATQVPVDAVAEVPEPPAGAPDESSEPSLYKWTDRNGVVHFGEKPPPEYAESAVKVLDL
jgi:hypothetical protein